MPSVNQGMVWSHGKARHGARHGKMRRPQDIEPINFRH